MDHPIKFWGFSSVFHLIWSTIAMFTLAAHMIRNVLTRRREYGTYLATARRHRRRIKMQKRDELRSFQSTLWLSSAVEVD